MTLAEAKEQIAKKEGYPGWNSLISALADDTVSASSDSFYQAAVNLVLSSKDIEIAELKKVVQDQNNIYGQDIGKYQSELSQLKEQNLQLSEQLDQDGDVIQSLQEEMNTMKIKYKQSLIVLRDICKSARLEGGMNTANELLSEL